jgi:multiple sugar transport system permease protein
VPTDTRDISESAGLPNPPLRASSGMRLRAPRWYIFCALLLLSISFVLPFGFTVSTSLKSQEETQAEPPTIIPKEFHPENYTAVARHRKFDLALYTRNTLVISLLTVLGTTLSSALVAYGFAKIEFRGRGTLFALVLSTMMIPGTVTLVSMFTIWRWLGDHTGMEFLGTFRPLWIPAWFGSAFNIFLLRQFFMTIPKDLSEAARIDGCSELGIFFRIMLPLARPALAVVALFAFMGAWNDFMGPLIFIQDPQQYTLALGLQAFQSQHGGTPWHQMMAASAMVIAPIIVLFFLVQKTFIQGIATTGMKG